MQKLNFVVIELQFSVFVIWVESYVNCILGFAETDIVRKRSS